MFTSPLTKSFAHLPRNHVHMEVIHQTGTMHSAVLDYYGRGYIEI